MPACVVCLEDQATRPLFLPCCNRVVCTECLTQWFALRAPDAKSGLLGTCPHCRSVLGRAFNDLVAPAEKARQETLAALHPNASTSFVWLLPPAEMASAAWRWLFTNKCPTCQRPVRREGGCPQMTCAAPCGASFRWADPLLFFANAVAFAVLLVAAKYMEKSLPDTFWSTLYTFPLRVAGILATVISATLFVDPARFTSNNVVNFPIAMSAYYLTCLAWAPRIVAWRGMVAGTVRSAWWVLSRVGLVGAVPSPATIADVGMFQSPFSRGALGMCVAFLAAGVVCNGLYIPVVRPLVRFGLQWGQELSRLWRPKPQPASFVVKRVGRRSEH